MTVSGVSVLWAGVAVACAVVVVVKVVRLRRRPEVWWMANLIVHFAIGIGSVFMINEAAVNDALGSPNIAHLLFNLAVVVAAGAVVVNTHALRVALPSTRWIVVHCGVCLTVCLAAAIAWSLAPLHEVAYATAREIPITGAVMTYDWIARTYVTAVLVNMIWCLTTTLPLTAHGDPARWAGHVVRIALSVIVVGQLLYLIRLAIQPIVGQRAVALAEASDLAIFVGMVGSAAGHVAMSVGPSVQQRIKARRLISDLRPLWKKLRMLHPEIQASTEATLHGNAALRAERMLIEIGDALSLLRVQRPLDGETDRIQVVVDALRGPTASTAKGLTAAAVLPQPMTRAQEESQVRELSRRFQGA